MEVCANVYGLLILEPPGPRFVAPPPRFVFGLGARRSKLSRSGSGGRPERSPSLCRQTKVIAQSGCAPPAAPALPGDADAALESRRCRGSLWPAVPRMGRSGGCSGWIYPSGSAGREMKVPGEEEPLPRGSGSSGGAGGPGPAARPAPSPARRESSSMAGPQTCRFHVTS